MVDEQKTLSHILEVIHKLTGPDGCPWDKKQTPQSLTDYLLEESYELVDAIKHNDTTEVKKELGDLFFLLLFISVLYEAEEEFTIPDIFRENAAKMINRHPHVFGETQVNDKDELLRNWEKIKREESTQESGLFDSLPKHLPPLLKAYRINSKAARVGFTWDSLEGVKKQLDLEWKEFSSALQNEDKKRQAEEFGDYVFTLTEFARRLGIKPNSALEDTNSKFLKRFKRMEEIARSRGTAFDELEPKKKESLWREVKKSIP